MENISKEKFYSNMSQIMRAYRKLKGLSLQEVSIRTGISVASLCKIENDTKKASGFEWIQFCCWSGIKPQSTMHGFFELENNLNLDNESKIGDFKLPTRYSYLKGSSVRLLLPFRQIATEKLGNKWMHEWFKSKGIDEDYLCILSNPINSNINYDLIESLIEEKAIKKEDLRSNARIFKMISSYLFHGNMAESYSKKKDELTLNRQFLDNISKKYEVNSQIKWITKNDNELTFKMGKKPHTKEYKQTEQVKYFESDYRVKFLKEFQGFDGHRPCKIDEQEISSNERLLTISRF